jgi:hypothetical protein
VCIRGNGLNFVFVGMCLQPMETQIEMLIKREERPFMKLYQHACNKDKADYGKLYSYMIRFNTN